MANTTLGDVLKYIEEKVVYIKLFGATGKYLEGFNQHCQALGVVIAEEQGVTKEEALELPPNTLLGERACERFDELQTWDRENS